MIPRKETKMVEWYSVILLVQKTLVYTLHLPTYNRSRVLWGRASLVPTPGLVHIFSNILKTLPITHPIIFIEVIKCIITTVIFW